MLVMVCAVCAAPFARQVAGSQVEAGLGGVCIALDCATRAAVAPEPGEGALDRPAPGLDGAPGLPPRLAGDLRRPPQRRRRRPGRARSRGSAAGCAPRPAGRRRDPGWRPGGRPPRQPAERADPEPPLAPGHLAPPVVAALPAGVAGRDALAVGDRRGGDGGPPGVRARPRAKPRRSAPRGRRASRWRRDGAPSEEAGDPRGSGAMDSRCAGDRGAPRRRAAGAPAAGGPAR